MTERAEKRFHRMYVVGQSVSNQSDEFIDYVFGRWIGNLRFRMGLAREDIVDLTEIPFDRLKALEWGEHKKGITYNECLKLAEAYHVKLDDLLDKACGKWSDDLDFIKQFKENKRVFRGR